MELGKYEVHEDIQNEDKWLKFFTLPQLGVIAMAAVIFGRFRPQGAIWGCILFAFCNGLRVIVGSNTTVSVNLISMIPYVATVICLVLFVGKAQIPAASGQPYQKSK